MIRSCMVDGCGRPHLARGRCQSHYTAWRRDQVGGKLPPKPRERPPSLSDLLGRLVDMLQAELDPRDDLAAILLACIERLCLTCRRVGCDRPARHRGLCVGHAKQPAAPAPEDVVYPVVIPDGWKRVAA